MRTVLLLVVTTLALLGVAAPATADAAPGGVGVHLVPESSAGDARERAYIIANPAPGTTVSRTVEVSNTTGSTQVVALYPGSAAIRDGQFVGDAADAAGELTSWTRVDTSQLTLRPGQVERVGVHIRVPDAVLEGERYGAIWAAVSVPDSGDSSVNVVNRAGIRMYISVGEGSARYDFTIRRVDASNGDPQQAVTATVENTGNRAIDLTGTLNLSRSGLVAGPFTTDGPTTLAPGDTDTIRITPGTDIPEGTWQAELDISGGPVTRSAETELTVPAESATTAGAGIATGWLVAAGIGGAAVIAALLVRARGLSRPRR